MIAVRRITPSLTAVMPGWLIVICGVRRAIPLARLAEDTLAQPGGGGGPAILGRW